jgi:hypothetical protein
MKMRRLTALALVMGGAAMLGCQEGTCASDKPYACEGTDYCCATLYLCGDYCVDDPNHQYCSGSNRVDCY